MLETKAKTYASSKHLCSDLNRHPEWQIVSVTDSTKPFKNPQMANGETVGCEHLYTLFYKTEDDEDMPAEDRVWELVEEKKKDDDLSLEVLPRGEWAKLVDIVSDLAKKTKPEKSATKPLSSNESDEILNDENQSRYIVSILDDGQTKFVKNLKYSYDNKLAEYDFCYSVDDADKFSLFDAVNLKKGLIKSYRLDNELPRIRSRKVDVLEVCK